MIVLAQATDVDDIVACRAGLDRELNGLPTGDLKLGNVVTHSWFSLLLFIVIHNVTPAILSDAGHKRQFASLVIESAYI
ncbi:hypothetical protein GCM10023333_39170 [Ferrimonas pelagia]|uniref:Uncharacterized protein n=1 Tax=Ferrimonas pelagia TaxID=1177826 RepID=A0ABP9FFI1_9GAMM